MEKTKLLIGVFVLIGLFGAGYYVADTDQANLYQCDKIVGLCFKLSAINDNGFQTRCYYNQSTPTRYKNCKTGWIKAELIEFTGTETNLPDTQDYAQPQFTTKAEAEIYLEELKSEVTYTTKITGATQFPYSDVINFDYKVNIMKGEDVVDYFIGSIGAGEDYTKEEIEEMVNIEAQRLFDNWKPSIIIDREDKLNV